RLAQLDGAVRAALGEECFVMAHYSHAYREGCSIYFTFAGAGNLDVYDRTWARALAAAAAAGGTVAHHHGVGQAKMEACAREMAGISKAFHELKRELDPLDILIPGRLFPEVDLPNPAAPAPTLDPLSQVATLPAQQGAPERDAALAREGWALRYPTELPLSRSLAGPRPPWDTRLLGASVVGDDGRRVVFVDVPRSGAGPDPRASFPARAYETVTVPIVRLGDDALIVDTLARDVRPARRVGTGWEIRGPAAPELARLCQVPESST
ncbi:MAG: hypothetical protein FJ102_21875, partial [Deltaproteobacteria bacterium]|nr:hypothetical protein [Deltaproteobacteria bacterium]